MIQCNSNKKSQQRQKNLFQVGKSGSAEKSIHVTYQIVRTKVHNHLVISTDAKKVPDKAQYLFLFKIYSVQEELRDNSSM